MLSQFIWNVKSRAVVSAVEAEVDSLPRGNWAGNGFTVNSSPVSRIPLVTLDSQENILEDAQFFYCRLLGSIPPTPTPYGLQHTEKKDSEVGKIGGHRGVANCGRERALEPSKTTRVFPELYSLLRDHLVDCADHRKLCKSWDLQNNLITI
jgi:hypothetical protein